MVFDNILNQIINVDHVMSLQKRKCTECSAELTDEHVMKIKLEDDSWETVPLTICPECFKKQIRKMAKVNHCFSKRQKRENHRSIR